MTQVSIHETPVPPALGLWPFHKSQKYFQSNLRDNLEEIAKLTLGHEIGGTLVASADVGFVMLRRAALVFMQSRKEQPVH